MLLLFGVRRNRPRPAFRQAWHVRRFQEYVPYVTSIFAAKPTIMLALAKLARRLAILSIPALCDARGRMRHAGAAWTGFGSPVQGWTLHANTNCYGGRGATEIIDVNIYTSTGSTEEADRGAVASLKCMQRCVLREGCTAFTTQAKLGQLHCWLRRDVVPTACEQGMDAKHFFTYVREPAAAGRRLQLLFGGDGPTHGLLQLDALMAWLPVPSYHSSTLLLLSAAALGAALPCSLLALICIVRRRRDMLARWTRLGGGQGERLKVPGSDDREVEPAVGESLSSDARMDTVHAPTAPAMA